MAKEHLKYESTEIDRRLDLAGTALQEHQDISHLASKTDVASGLNKKVDRIDGKGLSTEDYTTAEKQKLAALDTNIKQAVDELLVEVARKQDSIDDLEEIRDGARKGATAIQEHQDISNLATKAEVSQGLDKKVDKIEGKGLSSEDFTTILKDKLQGLNNYDDTNLSNAISSLQEQFNILVVGNPSDAINSFNEIIAFLDGVKDSQNLDGIIAAIEQQIAYVSANIPTRVSQLTNDSGYLTTHQDISNLATKEEIKGKQDIIDDLDTIRNGASKGATALQSVPSEYITETELSKKGYATASELTIGLNDKASIAQVESMIAEAITNTLNTEV